MDRKLCMSFNIEPPEWHAITGMIHGHGVEYESLNICCSTSFPLTLKTSTALMKDCIRSQVLFASIFILYYFIREQVLR